MLCPDLMGHLNPMMALGRELERAGHRVTFYQRLISRPKLEAAGFQVRAFAEQEFPVDVTRQQLIELAQLGGLKALTHTVEILRRRTAACLRDVPRMAREDRVDALVVDEVSWEGATIAEELGVPFVTVSNALVIHPDETVPPFPTKWRYSTSRLARWRNRLAYRLLTRFARPLLRTVNEHRVANGKRPYARREEAVSPLLMMSQEVAEFEFPRANLPACFRFVGPMVDRDVRESTPFPFEALDRRPLVYASMGTLQNRQTDIFGKIAAACDALPVQLVISLGGGASPDEMPTLPGNPLVVQFAPQLELLRRAKLCITHAGLNTTLESLGVGVPMVAIPITNDQPGVAARIAWTGCGELIEPKRLTAAALRTLVRRVLDDPRFTENARRLQTAIQRAGGAPHAAALVATAVRNGSYSPSDPGK
jgi:MGT family glycosyltransferase